MHNRGDEKLAVSATQCPTGIAAEATFVLAASIFVVGLRHQGGSVL